MGSDPTEKPSSIAAINDRIAQTRGLPAPQAATIELPPPAYQPTAEEDLKSVLSTLAKESLAETEVAMQVMVNRGSKLAEDLGKRAPDPAKTATMLADFQNINEALARNERQRAFLKEKQRINHSDISDLIDIVCEDIEHNAKTNSNLSQEYQAVLLVGKRRGEAIKKGFQRAKESKTKGSKGTGKNG